MTAETDRVLGRRYRLTERIAGGGMGEVWAAEDGVLGREVAVKILRREYADDPTFLERFRAEARHTAGLSHTGIAAVYDFGQGQDGGRVAVPRHGVRSAASRCPRWCRVRGTLAPERTLDIIGQAALGLQAAHDAGVIHRDVKPGNILVTPEGAVKITDFGIARATNSVPLTQTGAIMGTAYYISPEQASGRVGDPGAATSTPSGVVAYECLTGRRPFDGDTPVSVALAQVSQVPPALPEDLPEPVRELVMRMLAKEPAARPASAGELGREALAMRAAAAAAAPPGAHPRAAGRRCRRAAPGPATPDPRGDQTTVVVGRLSTDTDPGFQLPDVSRIPPWLPYALALAAAAVLLLVLVQSCGSDTVRTTPGSGSESSTGPTAATEVDVAARDYLGRPVDDVSEELVGLGLRVTVARSAGGGVLGTVKDVTPTGTLREGTAVTLDVVAEQPGTQEKNTQEKKSKPGKGHGRKKGR